MPSVSHWNNQYAEDAPGCHRHDDTARPLSEFIERHPEHDGIYSTTLDDRRGWRHYLPGASLHHCGRYEKRDIWKDASRDGRALLYCVEHLAR
jgi:hypothetical protein